MSGWGYATRKQLDNMDRSLFSRMLPPTARRQRTQAQKDHAVNMATIHNHPICRRTNPWFPQEWKNPFAHLSGRDEEGDLIIPVDMREQVCNKLYEFHNFDNEAAIAVWVANRVELLTVPPDGFKCKYLWWSLTDEPTVYTGVYTTHIDEKGKKTGTFTCNEAGNLPWSTNLSPALAPLVLFILREDEI